MAGEALRIRGDIILSDARRIAVLATGPEYSNIEGEVARRGASGAAKLEVLTDQSTFGGIGVSRQV